MEPMNKIEDLHKPHSKIWDCNNDIPLEENHALKSTEITTDVAVKFAEWIAENWVPNGRKGCWDSRELNSSRRSKYLIDSTETLFEEFINNHFNQ